MKRATIFFCAGIIPLSLLAFGVINWNNLNTDTLEASEGNEIAINTPSKMKQRVFTDFIYDVGPRFASIKKTDIDKARSIDDFLDIEQLESIVTIKSISIIIIKSDKQTAIREIGYTKELTPKQLELLQSSDYSTNFLVRAEFQEKNNDTGKLVDNYATPHHTIVPERQATYLHGKKALIKYLKENSMEARNKAHVEAEKLKPAKLYFTVTKNGSIENVKLDRSSNHPLVDKAMIELINKAPGKWEPAENIKGEKIDQELVVSFGIMGC